MDNDATPVHKELDVSSPLLRHRLPEQNDVSAVDVGREVAEVPPWVIDGAWRIAAEAPFHVEADTQTYPEMGTAESVPKYPWRGWAVQIAVCVKRVTESEAVRE